MVNFFKKYHKWVSIVLTVFILLFAVSGIVLNHRELFSGVNVNRDYLPEDYSYNNWNNAGVAGTTLIGSDSLLIYGNIGIWLTDTMASGFSDFNMGLPKGIDNRKISKIHVSEKLGIYAGTLFGLYKYSEDTDRWTKIDLPVLNHRIVDINEKGDTLLVLSRSHLIISIDGENFAKLTLPLPDDYDNKAGLFKTLWVIHSGEIWGLPGKLLVDAIGLIFIFLSITGIIYFIIPFSSKRKKRQSKSYKGNNRIRRFSLKWHNKIGWITLILLIITTATGMFLRPPLLAAIAYSKVGKIPYTELDSPNPWFDKLRRIMYLENSDMYLVATPDGIYYSDDNFKTPLKRIHGQPPVSVMGVTAFEMVDDNTILVGSFEGLFLWNLFTGYKQDYIKKGPVQKKKRGGPPLGEFLITGYSNDFHGKETFFDFNMGGYDINKGKIFCNMPLEIANIPMSLWNVALEVHTARIYKPLFGNFYILFIPLAGLLILFIQISGLIVWWKRH
jgi:PepSY-associated transmembrane protein